MKNIKEIEKQMINAKRKFTLTPGKRSHIIIYDFQKPKEERKYRKTTYIIYDCKFITRNNEKLPIGKYQIMIPGKTCWLEILEQLKAKNALKTKNICLTIIKKSNYLWEIGVHNRGPQV